MDRFARLFTLRFQLGDHDNRHPRLEREEHWRVIDRTIVLFGPPAIVNQEWTIGLLDLPCTEEDVRFEWLE